MNGIRLPRFFRGFCIVLAGIATLAHGAQKSNILIILVDDMGYSDPACFGGEITTPAIDRMAREGLRLTRFHNGAMCVVSRASMLTGKWWPRALPEFRETPLLQEKLQENGYRTALVGKWHLQGDPMDRGFDHFFGFLGGFSDHFGGSPDYRLDREKFTEFGPRFYSSDAFTDRAIGFIEASVEDPFEARDLSSENPKAVAKLAAKWQKWWQQESGKPVYTPTSTAGGSHYNPQGDRGSGKAYVPTAMPDHLSNRYPLNP